MNLVQEEKPNKRIEKEFKYNFEIKNEGLYVIEISARAKSWLQNTLKLISFFKDDDLAVRIDDIEFPKLSRKRGLFDSEAAWNGNKLKNLRQINLFFINLKTGEHSLDFIVNQSPYLETIKIYQSASEQNIVFEPAKNYKIEKGNRRPWFNFILIDIGFEKLKIQASADQGKSDDDDLQLKINGKRQINDAVNAHKYWYWCGRVLKGQSKTFYKEFNLSAGLHYVELWADNSPVLESVKLVFLEKDKNNGKDLSLAPYTYKGVNGDEDYNRYDAVIEEVVDYWNNEFLKDTDPPEKLLDPNLVKAIAYQESRIGYYPGAEVDVMQVGNMGDPALKTLKGELKEYWIHNGKQEMLEYADVNIEAVRDSIYWGVRWLYHKARGIAVDGGRYWRTWEEAVYKYGPGTREYADSVWHIYKNGIKKEKNDTIRLWTVALIVLLSSAFLLLGNNEAGALKVMIVGSFNLEQQRQIQDIEIKFYKGDPSLFLAIIEWEKNWREELKIGALENGMKWLKTENPPVEQSILSARFIDLDGFQRPIIEVYGKTHMGNGSLYLYEIKDDALFLIFKTVAVDFYDESKWDPENYQKYGYSTCGQIYEDGKLSVAYSDMNKDGMSDVVLTGKINVVCEGKTRTENFIKDTNIKVSEMPVNRIYLWDEKNQVFVEKSHSPPFFSG